MAILIGWGIFFVALNIVNVLLIMTVSDEWGCPG